MVEYDCNMKKSFTPFTYKVSKGETVDNTVITVPDQTLSLKNLLINHTRGIPLMAQYKEPVYNGDILVPNPHTLDLVDIDELRSKILVEEENLKQTVSKELDEKAEAIRIKKLQALEQKKSDNKSDESIQP